MFVAPLIYLLQFVTNILSIESLVNGHFQDFNVRYTAFEFKEQFIFFVFKMIIRIQRILTFRYFGIICIVINPSPTNGMGKGYCTFSLQLEIT